jgi:L-arabinokinase
VIGFYISGHGFGHASRQIEIVNALGGRLPSESRILIRTAAARWLFERTLRVPVSFHEGPCDTGIVQLDSLHLDEEATVGAAGHFYATFADRVHEERTFLREHNVDLVIADAPPLGCAAAAAAGVPSVVISNFTWDWIYEAYGQRLAASAPHVLPTIREAYRAARAGWRLPMHGGFAGFSSVRELPYVARHRTRSRNEVLATLDVPDERPLALLSFGGYGLDGFDWRRLDCLDEWHVVTTGRASPGDLPAGVVYVHEPDLYAAGFRYEDLVAAMDVVVTKPGYGIISECLANDVAMLYTSRGRFPEYDVMVREMPRVLRCEFLDQEALLGGRWTDALSRLRRQPAPPERPRTDGAEVAARWILDEMAFTL